MLVYIKPKSVFPELHSDTLFGAMVVAMKDLFPSNFEDMLDKFKSNNPPFIVSSTFPFLENDGKKVRFYPKVVFDDKNIGAVNRDVFKKFKKIEFLQEDIFFKILKGDLSSADILNNYDNYNNIGNLLMNEDLEIKKYSNTIIIPNNSVNRLDNSTNIFYSEGKNYKKGCGVFFFIKIFDKDYEPIIESIFRLLKDRGFGRDISVGKGQFDYEIIKEDLDDFINIEKSNKFITLSRFIPTDKNLENINATSSLYELGFKRSISRSFDLRSQVRFFKEGSSFMMGDDDFYGHVVPVGDNAIEYGYAFPLKYFKE